MKKYFVSIVILLFFAQISAQKDPQAQTILDNLSQTTKSYKSITVEFKYIFENSQENIKDSMNGSLFLAGEKYKLLFQGYERYFDGEKIVTVLLDAEEANITSPGEEDADMNPADLLTIYQKNFKYAYKGSEIYNGADVHVIDLFPMNPDDKKFLRFRLRIDQKKNQIVAIKRFDKDGLRFDIIVEKFIADKEYKPDFFTFSKESYPDLDLEVIDMR